MSNKSMNYPIESVKARLASFHKAVQDIPGHAIEVWEDGEITSTKCSRGELYGMRSLHCLVNGFHKSIPREVFPEHTKDHSFVRVMTYEEAKLIREIIESNL